MDEKAEVGIGTMIVFIATVLVAAVAAAVLIDMSGKLQERSARTGSEATEQVSSNLAVESIIGKRDATTDTGLQDMEVYVVLAPGAKDVDLEQLKMQVQDGDTLKTLGYGTIADATNFTATAVRDADSSFSAANPVMTSGDLVRITIDLDTATGIDLEMEPRENVRLVLLPEVGNSVVTGFSTPNSYGTNLILELQ